MAFTVSVGEKRNENGTPNDERCLKRWKEAKGKIRDEERFLVLGNGEVVLGRRLFVWIWSPNHGVTQIWNILNFYFFEIERFVEVF